MTIPATAILRAGDVGAATPALMSLSGRTLIDRALDRLAVAGVGRVFVEPQGGAAALERHLAARPPGPDLVLLPPGPADHPLAATVAGLLADGRLAAHERFFVVDGDVAWFDGPAPALLRLAHGFDSAALDGVLLLARATSVAAGSDRPGLALDSLGFVRRPAGREITPFVFAGVQILSTPPFRAPAHAAALDRLWDDAIARHRLGGQVHDSDWFQLGSHADLALAETGFDDRLAGVRP